MHKMRTPRPLEEKSNTRNMNIAHVGGSGDVCSGGDSNSRTRQGARGIVLCHVQSDGGADEVPVYVHVPILLQQSQHAQDDA